MVIYCLGTPGAAGMGSTALRRVSNPADGCIVPESITGRASSTLTIGSWRNKQLNSCKKTIPSIAVKQ